MTNLNRSFRCSDPKVPKVGLLRDCPALADPLFGCVRVNFLKTQDQTIKTF